MFGPVRYLQWARRFHGKVRFDLATSGMPAVNARDIGMPDLASVDDPSAWARLPEIIAAHNDVPREEAIAALGTTHALWLAYASLTAPGDDVLVEDPAYEPLVRIAEGVGAGVVRFAREPGQRFALDPDRVARAMTPRTRVVVVTNPHNPSGVRVDDDVLRACARVAEAGGASLVVNEIYAEFDDFVDARGVFRRSARKLGHNAVAVSSLTKCYGLGSHRIGWLLGPADVVERARDAATATYGVLPLPYAHGALRAFECLPALAERTRGTLSAKRERVAAWVESRGLRWSGPREGLFGFVTWPGEGDLTATIEAAAREEQVLVVPGTFFGAPGGFRVAWSVPMDVLDEGLSRLGNALDASRG